MKRSVVIFVVAAVFAVVLPGILEASASKPKAPATRPAQASSSAKKPLTPVRIRKWPAMGAWMRGQRVSREPGTMPTDLTQPELEKLGASVFALYCVNCHGDAGKGDGPRAPVFTPVPRDFTRGQFKFRSTPTGELPTKQDLFRTISGGLHGTGMPAFADLPSLQRWALVAHLRTLSPKFSRADADVDSLPIPAVPTALSSRVERGRDVYVSTGCVKCHGELGIGDGPGSDELVDDRGLSSSPRNFAVQPFKYGDAPSEIYRTLVTGLDGTPMPSYDLVLGESQVWDLVAYVRSLIGDTKTAKVSQRDVAEARRFVQMQRRQAKHAVVGGCGCQAKRRP